MQKRQLGNSDLEITPIGFGSWAVGGGKWEFGWGDQDDNESIEAIHRALALGVNWIDTAAVYGLGHSEEVVARALRSRPEKPYVFTKNSLVWDEQRNVTNSLKASSIRKEAENSLKRLGVEAIDLYQIHWPNPETDIEEGWSEMAKLQKEGKVRYLGVSNFNVEQMRRVQKIAPITSLQPPYSLIKRDVEKDILDFCLQNNIGVIAYSPMQSGLLTGRMTPERIAKLPDDDWRRNDQEFKQPRLSRNLQLVDLLTNLGEPHSVSPGVVAIAWTLRHPAVTAAIVGGRRPSQVNEIIDAAEFRLSESELAEIDTFLAEHP